MLCSELAEYLADMPERYMDEWTTEGRVIHLDPDFEERWFGKNWRFLYPDDTAR